jgi:hypothetical protein
MRIWLFHPLIFYPIAALFAAFLIVVSVKPQSWPRAPAPVAAAVSGGTLTVAGDGLGAPQPGPGQNLTVVRDFWGHASALRIAQLPNQAPPGANEDGVRVLLSPETARLLDGKPVSVEVTYNPLAINAASGLALSLRGQAPAPWISRTTPPQSGRLRFELPAQARVTAIGLRALSSGGNEAYGLEITRMRISPRAEAPAPN